MTGQVKLLTAKEVLVMTGYKSRTTLWRRVKSGEFPAPIALIVAAASAFTSFARSVAWVGSLSFPSESACWLVRNRTGSKPRKHSLDLPYTGLC